MAWQSSSYGGTDPRMSPPQRVGLAPRHSVGVREAPQQTPMPHQRHSMPNHEGPPPRQSPPQYRPYPPPPHHRSPYGAHQPSHPPPPTPTLSYDRYYEYHSNYPPSQPRSQYGHPVHYSEGSPEHRASPPGASYRAGSPGVDTFRTGGCTCKKSRCLKLYCQCFALSTTCGPKCKCQTCYNTSLHAESIEEARMTILERNPSAFDDKFRGGAVTPSPYRGPPPPTPVYHHSSPPSSNWPPSAYTTPSTRPQPMTSTATPPGPPPPPPRVNKFGCKCRRSFCLKKYCECYQNSVKCGLNCRCTNCRNYAHDGNGLPPPRPPPMVVPVTYGPASPRCVSNDTDDKAVSVTPATDEQSKKADTQDRMAIMAAVAMTELFGSKKEQKTVSVVEKADEKFDDGAKGATSTPEPKRKRCQVPIVSSPEKSDNEETTPPQKRAKQETAVEAYTPSGRFAPESRNPSPVSVMTPQNSYPRHFIQRPPTHPSSHHLPPPPHHHLPYHHPPAPMLPQHLRYAPRRTFHSYYPSPPQPRATSYEDVIKSSGLPKALSFRKICSKCGKTRGEHGELGFGNKCVFQECGKCGAGVQMHTKAGSSMGILCRLTVEEGATPGAAVTYERKIRELAARAELQKTLLEDKRERVERLVAQPPFVATA